jgi:hypothetical protein
MRETFIIKSAWKDIFDDLGDKQAGVLIKAVFNYMATGEKPTMQSDLEIKMAFKFMALDLDTFKDKYERKCTINKENGTKGADFGKLGGRPRKSEKTPKNPQRGYDNPENPERPLTDNDTDNDLEKDTKNSSNEEFVSMEKDFAASAAECENHPTVKLPHIPTKEEKEKSCAKKEKEFREELSAYTGLYGADMILAFFNYWTERNKSGTRLRFELEKTWETGKRLVTWSNRSKQKTQNYGQPNREYARKSQSDFD